MEEEKKDANFLLKDFSENTTTHGPKNIVSAVRVWAKEIVSRSSDWIVFIIEPLKNVISCYGFRYSYVCVECLSGKQSCS